MNIRVAFLPRLWHQDAPETSLNLGSHGRLIDAEVSRESLPVPELTGQSGHGRVAAIPELVVVCVNGVRPDLNYLAHSVRELVLGVQCLSTRHS